jgi:uncharacterized protein YidB (DUF937 family)
MNLSKPLLIGLGALLVGRILGGSGTTAQSSAPQGGQAQSPDGGLVGGLSGLLEKLQSAGHGQTAQSWVGPGQNQSIEPGQLRSALGSDIVKDAARQAGVSEQEFLSQLAQHLPQVVDQLTPHGRVPGLQEIAAALTRK